MNLLKINFSFIALVSFFFCSCNNSEENIGSENEIVYTHSDSPYHIVEDIVVDSLMKLIVLPGAELIFHDTAEIRVHGSIHIVGTKENPIILKPFEADSLWGGVKLLQPDDSCIFKGVTIINGLIYGENADVIVSDYSAFNNYPLDKFDALIRLFYGSVQIQNSYFESNHTGEGLLIHDIKENVVLIENCEFHGVPDAIEYLRIGNNGIIRKNMFYNIQQFLGDGIDLNGCTNILIEDNYFENIRDFGIEVGNDKFGPSRNIYINKNIFVNCFKGVVVKGGSNARLINNTFYGNGYGVACKIEKFGNNSDPNKLEVINSIFSESKKSDFLNNKNSTINFVHCLSDSKLFVGEANLFADPLFVSKKDKDFRLSDKSPCIGAGKINIQNYKESNCKDIGAICFDNE